MPYIALFLTILFVLFVLKIDFKRKSNVSSALWIPLIWMMDSASRPISFWLGLTSSATTENMSYIEGSPIDRYFLTILIIFNLYILQKRNIEWTKILKKNAFITLWFLYCGMSILWSDFPTVSFKRWIKEIGLFLSVLVVLTEIEPMEAVKILVKKFAYILISFSILLIMYFPEIGISGYTSYTGPFTTTGAISYSGISYTKNGLGRICLISGFFFFYNLVTMRQINTLKNGKENVFVQVLFLIMIFYLLIILNSATSFGGLVIGIISLIMLGTKVIKKNMKYLGIYIIFALGIGIILELSFEMISMFVTSLGRDLTLTGRTLIWKGLLAFRTNPLIGVGYGGFWLGKRLVVIQKMWDINQSHNGYLSVYLELGLIGICLLTGVIYFAYRNIIKELLYNFDYGRFRMAMFVIALLYNITEANIGNSTLMWFVFLLVAVDIPQKSQLYSAGKVTAFDGSSPR